MTLLGLNPWEIYLLDIKFIIVIVTRVLHSYVKIGAVLEHLIFTLFEFNCEGFSSLGF